MNEEKRPSSSETELRPKRQHSALVYLLILALAAFLLLFLAYFMQQRSSQEIMGNLNELRESMSSIQSVDDLLEDNRSLREEIAALREQLGEAQGQLVDAQGGLSQERQRAELAEEQTAALLLLEKLEYLCQTEQYEPARSMDGWADRLPQVLAELDAATQSQYKPGQPTLTERYQAVIDALEAN